VWFEARWAISPLLESRRRRQVACVGHVMRTSTTPTPNPELRLLRPDGYLVVIASLGMACTPLRDLSSYSGAPGSSAGSGSDTLGAMVDSPSRPAPLEDVGAIARPDAAVPRAPPPVAASDAGGGDAASSSAPACDAPGDVVAEGGGCYAFVAAGASWAAASAACSAWGGALARVESPEEDAFLLERVTGDTWLGLSDSETEGVLRWENGMVLGAYGNWATDQPDDFDGSEDCVELLADGRGWNDRPCTDLRAYVCER
jgi:hypothetical protein